MEWPHRNPLAVETRCHPQLAGALVTEPGAGHGAQAYTISVHQESLLFTAGLVALLSPSQGKGQSSGRKGASLMSPPRALGVRPPVCQRLC